MKNTFLILILKILNICLHTITLGIPKLTSKIDKKIKELEELERKK